MLVFTLKDEESFWVGDNCKIIVVSAGKHKTRVVIDAPKEIRIMRNALREKELEPKALRVHGDLEAQAVT